MKAGASIRFASSLLTLAVGTALAGGHQSAGENTPAAISATARPTQAEIDPQALARARQKFSLALKATHRFDSFAAQESLGDNWRQELLAHLMKIDESDFATVESSNSIADAVSSAAGLAGKAEAPPRTAALLGDTSADLTYIPINPCRILDTRAGSGTWFSAGQTRTYSYNNINTGANSSCNPNPGQYPGTQRPSAIAANVTVDESGFSGFTAGSFLAIYPQGGTAGTSFINFGPGQILANAGVFSINPTSGQFTVLASAPAQVIIDVFGVFVAPAPTALECITMTTGSGSIPPGFGTNFYSSACTSGYSTTGAICLSDDYSVYVVAVDLAADGAARCAFKNTDNVAHTVSAAARCCRVPGRN